MTPQQLDSYFAGEAGDYLVEMEEVLSGPTAPDADRFLRLAIGVRGTTRMAGAEAVARLAGRLEDAARALVASRLRWRPEVQEIARRTVGDIRSLMGALDGWGLEEERQVQWGLERWSAVLDEDSADTRPVVPIDTLFYDDHGPHVVGIAEAGPPLEGGAEVSGSPAGSEAVPIESLLLTGPAAIREALALRPAFEALASGDAILERPIGDLVDELFDLLEQGLIEEEPEA